MAPSVTARHIGEEREPVVVIDNFSVDPAALRAAASEARFAPADQHYPGIRAPVPPAYLAEQRALLSVVLREVFGVTGKLSVLDIAFSIVTTPPAALSLEQRLPHVDALEPGRLALIHYLGGAPEDGTAFYRHRSTGYETVDQARSEAYFTALKQDIARHGPPPPAYLDGDTPVFAQTARFDGQPNRALLYRGRMLHSGAIRPGRALPADPATGRLTITGFFASAL